MPRRIPPMRVDMPKPGSTMNFFLRLDSAWMFVLRMIRPSTLIGKFLWRPDRSLWDARPMPNYAELPEAERRMREQRVREAAKSSIRLRESIARERSAEKNR